MHYNSEVNNSGPRVGRTHKATSTGGGAPNQAEIRHTLEDDASRAYFILNKRARRILFSGKDADDLTDNERALVREWVSHPETIMAGEMAEAIGELVAA